MIVATFEPGAGSSYSMVPPQRLILLRLVPFLTVPRAVLVEIAPRFVFVEGLGFERRLTPIAQFVEKGFFVLIKRS